MEWFRQLGRAIRNLARLAREQPIWAITALTLSPRSEEHTSALQSLMRISYAGFCLKKKTVTHPHHHNRSHIDKITKNTPTHSNKYAKEQVRTPNHSRIQHYTHK